MPLMTNSSMPPSHNPAAAVAVPAAAFWAQPRQALLLLLAALVAALLCRMAMKGREAALMGRPFMRIMATLLPLAMWTILQAWGFSRQAGQQQTSAGAVLLAMAAL